MEALFTIENLISLFMLIVLQAVLGFDNLLYISLESQRAPLESQRKVRQWGIGIAVALRLVLLFVIMRMIQYFQDPIFALPYTDIIEGTFNLHAIIVLFGGVFILYTATKEIMHMLSLEDDPLQNGSKSSVFKVITLIVMMNLVFSFDSILSALALSNNYIIMATAIIIGGILMIWLSDHVASFLQKNRMFEVLGLFILFIVGILLLSEGAHLAHLKIIGHDITPMSKATFYFVIFVLIVVDLVQSRYQKGLNKIKSMRRVKA